MITDSFCGFPSLLATFTVKVLDVVYAVFVLDFENPVLTSLQVLDLPCNNPLGSLKASFS